jgi:hypothetical protein
MLVFAVPFWGTQYKLSLYHSLDGTPGVPVAKLLSQKERPVSSVHLERLAASAEPSSTNVQTLDAGALDLLLCALLVFTFGTVPVLGLEETPRLSTPVVSRSGPRAPPIFA